jgi:hypothetical protein
MALSVAQAQESKMRDDLHMVAPALEKYTQDAALAGQGWRFPIF